MDPSISERVAVFGYAGEETGSGYVRGPEVVAQTDKPLTSYSGGWEIKMGNAAAKLLIAYVLMLDGPSSHLDVNLKKWLEDWLEALPGSIVCTSCFSPCLDNMRIHVIDFQDCKLKTFKGVKNYSNIIFYRSNVTFQYPAKNRPTIMEVSLILFLVSRVAWIDANGADKFMTSDALIDE